MKILLLCFGLAIGLMTSAPAVQAGEDLPFTLPLKHYLPIPMGSNGDAMSFFYGQWNTSMPGGPMTIKKDLYAHYETGSTVKETPYRVLAVGENYVLVLSLLQFEIEEPKRTEFEVFFLGATDYPDGRDPHSARMGVHSCSDFNGSRGEQAFRWTRQRLLNVFAETCGKNIDPDADGRFEVFKGYWSYSNYMRPK